MVTQLRFMYKNEFPIKKDYTNNRLNLNLFFNRKEGLNSILSSKQRSGLNKSSLATKISITDSNSKLKSYFSNNCSFKKSERTDFSNNNRKQSARDLANLSFTTFQKISCEKQQRNPSSFIMRQFEKIDNYKSAALKADRTKLNGFNQKNVPTIIKKYDWAKKEKWENSNAGNISNKIFRSFLLSSTNKNNKVAREVLINGKIKPKEDYLIDSFCLEEGKKLNEMRRSNNELPLIKTRKIQLNEVKYKTKSEFMGEKYSPHNYQVDRHKRNTCSLRSFTFTIKLKK